MSEKFQKFPSLQSLSLLDEDQSSFRMIKRALVAQMGSVWKVGDRLPPIKELARSMSVSPNSVQKAISELVSEGVLFSRRRVGLRVLALPEQEQAVQRRPLGPLAGKTIGLVVCCDPILPFIQRMITGFGNAIESTGAVVQNVMTCFQEHEFPTNQTCWGMVLFNPSSGLNVPGNYRNLTVVTSADHLQPDLISRADRVGVDQYQGGMLAGSLMRDAGCKRICFIGRRIALGVHRYDMTSGLRLNGFEQTWGSHLEVANQIYSPGYSINSGALAFTDYMAMSPRPDGVFAASDELAVGFMAGATAAGLKAGKDYQLVGFDGQDERESANDALLSTIRVPAAQMGQAAAQMMMLRASDESRCLQNVAIPCSLIAGKTVQLDHQS